MFEMTFGDGRRRGMAFDGHDAHGVFMTKGGSMITKRDWPKMKRTLTFDDNELSSSGERDGAGTQDWLAKLRGNIKKLALKAGLNDGEYQKLLDKVVEQYAGPRPADGAGATDDDDDDLADFRKHLAAKGLNTDDIEEACKIARRDREGAVADSRPENALHGGFGGRFSDAVKDAPSGRYPGIANVLDDDLDLSADYGPGFRTTTRDYYGTRPEPPRLGGSSRAMQAGDAAFDDETIERQLEEDYGSSGPKVGAFG
jgi:hypothetical protein